MSTNPALDQNIIDDPELAGMLFGEPDSAMDQEFNWEQFSSFLDNDDYYLPPIPFDKLARTFRTNAYHGAMPTLKANRVARYLVDNPLVSQRTLINVVIDHQTLGNAVFRLTQSKGRGGRPLAVEHYPMMKVRRMKEKGRFGYMEDGDCKPFKIGEIVHLMEYDPFQKIYGTPFWLPALHSILLGESIRTWPRRFFENGMHAQMLIVTSGLGHEQRKVFNKNLKEAKGKNALKSLVQHFNRGEVDKLLKIIDFAENVHRIDYSKLAAMTNRDIMAAWRTPPELAGQMPENYSGSGDLNKTREMYHENEIVPLQEMLQEALNPLLPGRYQLQFRAFENDTD